jgi:hypothetical protein
MGQALHRLQSKRSQGRRSVELQYAGRPILPISAFRGRRPYWQRWGPSISPGPGNQSRRSARESFNIANLLKPDIQDSIRIFPRSAAPGRSAALLSVASQNPLPAAPPLRGLWMAPIMGRIRGHVLKGPGKAL